MAKPPVPAVPSAALLLVRDAAAGLEVFMLKRHGEVDFVPGAMVFPGGKLDPGDAEPALGARCCGGAGLAADDLALRVGAIREAFEECGVLLARARGERELVSGERLAGIAARHRADVHAGRTAMGALAESEDLELACDLPVRFAHWITPEFMPRRYDTHFFLVPAPEDQEARHEDRESTDSLWIAPGEAVEAGRSGRLSIIFPTLMQLSKLARSASVAAALEMARSEPVVPVLPRLEKTPDGPVLRIPEDAGYDVSVAPLPGPLRR